ncbi:MAG: hypothetical protein ACE5QF_06530 [Thermoplasmata archaeon]
MDRLKVSSILLVIAAVITIIFGLVYLTTPRLLSYHEDFIGMTHDEISEINPKLTDMMLTFLRAIGTTFVVIGMMWTAVSLKSFRRGEKWAWSAMLITGLATLIPVIAISFYVGAPVVYAVIAVLIIFMIAIALPAKEFLS